MNKGLTLNSVFFKRNDCENLYFGGELNSECFSEYFFAVGFLNRKY